MPYFTYNNDESNWGEGVTRPEAERLAEILCGRLAAEFPDIEFKSRYGVGEDTDLNEQQLAEVSYFMEDMWTECFEHPDMVWDLRAIYEDNSGQLYASYGDLSLAAIDEIDSPEELANSGWLANSTADVYNATESAEAGIVSHPETRMVFDNQKLWCNGWGHDECGKLGAAGKEYRARHIDDDTIKDAWDAARQTAEPELVIDTETGCNTGEAKVIWSSDLASHIYVDEMNGWKLLSQEDYDSFNAAGAIQLADEE